MNAASVRKLLRWGHIFGGASLAMYFYSPLGSDETFATMVRFGVVPALTLSGLIMWQQGRIKRFFSGSSSRT